VVRGGKEITGGRPSNRKNSKTTLNPQGKKVVGKGWGGSWVPVPCHQINGAWGAGRETAGGEWSSLNQHQRERVNKIQRRGGKKNSCFEWKRDLRFKKSRRTLERKQGGGRSERFSMGKDVRYF